MHTSVPYVTELTKYLQQKGQQVFAVKANRESAMRQLKALDPAMEVRSIRRGAITAMAMNGTTDEVLMTFSGHTRIQSLMRYMDNGLWRSSRRAAGTEAAEALGKAGAGAGQVSSNKVRLEAFRGWQGFGNTKRTAVTGPSTKLID